MTATFPIPETADEVIESLWESDVKRSASYWLAGQRAGYRSWTRDGQLDMEYGVKDDRQHGAFRTWHENGQICEETYYHEGKEHGTTHQYDQDGNLIGSYTMVYGTGVDLWYDRPGVLSEERHYQDGLRHGYERWWDENNATVWQESHYQQGVEHGVFRRWNQRGRLCRGYPHYFVAGQRVTKRQYLCACVSEPSLPPFEERENLPNRALPVSVNLDGTVASEGG